MKERVGYIHLENGDTFTGRAPEWVEGTFSGEVVFTTGMTGYYESLTDPSYCGQILVFTYPLIGNYGIPNRERWESDHVQVSGVVVSEICEKWSHAEGKESLVEWLRGERIPILSGVDTRHITTILRERGVMLGAISTDSSACMGWEDPNGKHLVSTVTCRKKQIIGKGKKKILLIDCGMKENICRSLAKYDVSLVRVPYNYHFLDEEYDAVFISNGPGNPEMCKETVANLQVAMERDKPIFGICLGSQIMALAAGGQTYKLRYGHRGHNQPCMHLPTNRCFMTSQNHGYAIKESSLPKGWEVSYRNVNDGTVEGIRHKEKPFAAVQFHPEAAPGPTDTEWIFEEFLQEI